MVRLRLIAPAVPEETAAPRNNGVNEVALDFEGMNKGWACAKTPYEIRMSPAAMPRFMKV